MSGPGGYGTCTVTYTVSAFQVGETVMTIAAASLYTGTTIVGSVQAGATYQIAAIQGAWVSLKQADGTVLPGWIQASDLEVAPLAVGDTVTTIAPASLYTGTQVMGSVQAGATYQIASIQGEWASLKQADGTVLPGWIQVSDLQRVNQ